MEREGRSNNSKRKKNNCISLFDLLTCFRDKVKLNMLIQRREEIFIQDWLEVLNDAL